MTDWKKKIDDEEKVRITEQRKREAAEAKAAQKKETDEWNSKVEEHGKKFKCGVCDKPSQKPGSPKGTIGTEEGAPSWSSAIWSYPGDLWRCGKCKKWTCVKHIHKGVCKECAEKM